MYLQPEQVHELIAACVDRITKGTLLFDAAPRWLSERTQREPLGGPAAYRPPPWTWGIDAAEIRRIRTTRNVAELRRLRLPRGRGPFFGSPCRSSPALPASATGSSRSCEPASRRDRRLDIRARLATLGWGNGTKWQGSRRE